ncbi:hypothetical protein PM032_04805 [Halorubrum ezzemoulense]|uniref:hypothetical protein n=1 Tax=Halorubrum ezzemoulense TaxID=337243 RepID=UPI00232D7329|nr:hypothetical protein [Halorubrum ezzemoulense]MDB2270343.1 hypothetical protein [Halorubrum ezzemoulense]
MANRRKFIAGLGALATGSAAAMGTGAFSSVRADRDLVVDTAYDENAFLGLSANPDYDDIVTETSSNQLSLTIDKLNEDAYTEFADLFRISNQGTQNARVWIDTSNVPDSVGMGAYSIEDGTFDGGPGPNLAQDSGPAGLSNGRGVILAPASSVKVSPYFSGELAGVTEQTVELKIYAITENSELAPDSFNFDGYNDDLEPSVNPNYIDSSNSNYSQDTPSY